MNGGEYTTQEVSIPRPTGRACPGFVAAPVVDSGVRVPGVVVIHEAFGLTDNIRDIARRFAVEGYAALAVDLFSSGPKALCMVKVMSSMLIRPVENDAVRDLVRAVDWLRERPGVDPERLGAIGFCMGGGFALSLATVDQRVHAASVFYGRNPRPISLLAKLCPVVGSYAEPDMMASEGRVLDAELTRHGIPHDVKHYPGARHSFFNDTSRNHDPAAAADAWARTLSFFTEHLAPRA